ncbi:MAG: hypothetical protein QOG26_382 [Solirubrobacterales bacterium]|jgi:hypothetical protein|nr:hypothetical protein [Solirubrobacterales bacterium]MDX6651300.1 hypothetical protein [Solirubrobacterales bacterium]
MLYADLLRLTVLLAAAEATALAGVSLIAANRDGDTLLVILAVGWWFVAGMTGIALGREDRAAQAVGQALADSRTATSLPQETPGRIAFQRLWPIAAFAVFCGGVAWIWPQIPAIGAGYALLFSLAWRNREAAVLGIEDRDGVRFYVEPTSAMRPISLVRTPGLRRDRPTPGHPPPPAPSG